MFEWSRKPIGPPGADHRGGQHAESPGTRFCVEGGWYLIMIAGREVAVVKPNPGRRTAE
jgi:hypothetical protein